MNIENRRRHTRVVFQTMADLRFADAFYEQCPTKDLSLSGTFIKGVRDRRQGEICEVSLHLIGGASDILLTIKGEVVRVDSEGLALRFFEIDIDSFVHLKNIIYFNAKDPDIMDEEWPGPLSAAS